MLQRIAVSNLHSLPTLEDEDSEIITDSDILFSCVPDDADVEFVIGQFQNVQSHKWFNLPASFFINKSVRFEKPKITLENFLEFSCQEFKRYFIHLIEHKQKVGVKIAKIELCAIEKRWHRVPPAWEFSFSISLYYNAYTELEVEC